jgi:hypothetical protein
MSKLKQWLDHCMEVVGTANLKDLSEYSSVSEMALRDINACGSLDVLSRSERRLLASALRVSLRRLEQLNNDDIDWIEDAHVFDPEVRGRLLPFRANDPAYWLPTEIPAEDRGTPLLGRIRPSGQAEADEEWQDEWGRRLPARFGNGYDIYALELEGVCQSIVFRNIPPWEFREGPAAVYCWNGWETRGLFGQVQLAPLKAIVVTPDGQRHEIDPLNIVRIGKIIGRWPQGSPHGEALRREPDDSRSSVGSHA